jgi:hypothetical protein
MASHRNTKVGQVPLCLEIHMHNRQAIAVALALLGQQEIAFAESADASAKAMMGSCRDLVNARQLNGVGQAKCLGIVRAMHYFARYYFGACTPSAPLSDKRS